VPFLVPTAHASESLLLVRALVAESVADAALCEAVVAEFDAAVALDAAAVAFCEAVVA
jgi:hypothetical protein